jgi:hypothetical protein
MIYDNLWSKKHTCLYRYRPMKADGIDGATKPSTSQLPRSIPNVPCLKRHEIKGNYYAVKKIRGKIKTHALRSESHIAITDRKLAERKLREWLVWKGRRAFNLRAFFQIIGQPMCRRFLQFFLCPTEAYAQTLILGPTEW